MGCHSLLLGIFLTQGSNPGLLHCRKILYHLSHQRSPQWKTTKCQWSTCEKESAHVGQQEHTHALTLERWYCRGSVSTKEWRKSVTQTHRATENGRKHWRHSMERITNFSAPLSPFPFFSPLMLKTAVIWIWKNAITSPKHYAKEIFGSSTNNPGFVRRLLMWPPKLY